MNKVASSNSSLSMAAMAHAEHPMAQNSPGMRAL